MKKIWNRIESLSFEEVVERYHRELFKEQLVRRVRLSRFYKKKLETRGKPLEFSLDHLVHFPFTEKTEILDDQNLHPPFGSNLTTPQNKISRISRTSGTSATPYFLALSKKDLKWTRECGARCFWAAGLRPGKTIINCMNYCMWAGGVTDQESMERTGATVIPYGVGESSNLIRTLLRIRPEAFHSTPSYLGKLEKLLKEEFNMAPLDLGLKLGFFGGEGGLQNPEFRRKIEETWGFQAFDANYGMADVLSMFGSECPVKNGLHFMGQGVVHPELIDLQTLKPKVIKKGVQGELVLTNLCKEIQPLLRYRTRDIISIVDDGKCECGRWGFRFKVIGRREDFFVVKGINVFLSGIQEAISRKLDVLSGEFRVLINKEEPITKLLIKVEVKPGENRPTLQAELEHFFKSTLFIKPEIELLEEGSLSRSEGKTKRLERVL